jgi:hemoglobin-like flavoprotein
MKTDIITIIDNNIRYLKSCLDLTESHITWGNKNIKKKYSKVKETLLSKMKEQLIDKRYYEDVLEYYPKIYQVL